MIDVAGFLSTFHELDSPYGFYDELRAQDRVLWTPQLNRWLVTGHREASALLRHEHVSSDRRNWTEYELPPGLDRPPGGLVSADPPEHTRLRVLVQQAFTPRLVERLRARVVELTDALLTKVEARGEFDLMADFANPLPTIVLAELLGIPVDDQALFRGWTTTFIETIDPVSHRMLSAEGTRAHAELRAYLLDIIDERRADPRPDLISGLVAAEGDGARLSVDELLEMCLLLTIAGLETTANLIGNGLYALLLDPPQLARLRAEPALIGPAVEELLRFDAPIQLSGRIPLRDIELGGHLLRPGQMVGIMLGAANRDPVVFAAPDRLDLTRTPNPHLAFGRGIHFCLGAPLARLEGTVGLGALVSRFPRLRLAGEPKRRVNVHVRGYAALPLAVE